MDWLLTNGTVIDVLSIGEEALDEERLLYVRRRVARLLGLGSEDGPFPYVTREVMEALMVPGPLAVQNGRSYRLTAKGLRLYRAGLIAESDKGYVLTEKGRRVLELLKEATSLESRLMYIMAELAREIEEV